MSYFIFNVVIIDRHLGRHVRKQVISGVSLSFKSVKWSLNHKKWEKR